MPIHTATTHTGCCHPPSWLLPPWQAGPKHIGRFASLPAVEHHRPCSASPVLQALLWPTGRLAFSHRQSRQSAQLQHTACLSICCLSVSSVVACLSLSVSVCLCLPVCLSNLVKVRASLLSHSLHTVGHDADADRLTDCLFVSIGRRSEQSHKCC